MEALTLIEEFSPRQPVWQVDWDAFSARLKVLVSDPWQVNQAEQNLCGPAAFFALWLAADPTAAVQFALEFYEAGSALIGEMEVVPRENAILGRRYEDLETGLPPAEWVLLGGLRDSENELLPFHGDGTDSLSGVTLPKELARWLRETGAFGQVREDANLVFPLSLEHAMALPANSPALVSTRLIGAARQSLWGSVLDAFPNHWVVLRSADATDEGVVVDLWTFGEFRQLLLSRDDFEKDYYGGIALQALQ